MYDIHWCELPEEVVEMFRQLKSVLPARFWSAKNLDEYIFHLTEDVAGKVDGTPLKTENIPSLYSVSPMVSLYDHTKGCPTRCVYCGYVTKFPSDDRDGLVGQLELRKKERKMLSGVLNGKTVSSMYFGGGTPTILPDDLLEQLIIGYRNNFKFEDGAEITVETHPLATTREKLETLKRLDINRVSIGIQSLDDDILRIMKRGYTRKQALEQTALILDKFKIVNTDLIYGIGTLEQWRKSVAQLINLGVPQITTYGLWLYGDAKVCEDFRLGNRDNYSYPEQRILMYLLGKHLLLENGYKEDLAGWFVKTGPVSVYKNRWKEGIPCVGIGENAYSYGPNWHYSNTKYEEYESLVNAWKLPMKLGFSFGPVERTLKDIMWGIKSNSEFELDSETGQTLVKPYIDMGLISCENGKYKMTKYGCPVREWMIGDIIKTASLLSS